MMCLPNRSLAMAVSLVPLFCLSGVVSQYYKNQQIYTPYTRKLKDQESLLHDNIRNETNEN